MCDQLLVPEENEDLWKKNDPNRTLSNDGKSTIFLNKISYMNVILGVCVL